MGIVNRFSKNPILTANPKHIWEAEAAFNGCPVWENKKIHFLYRAISALQTHLGNEMRLSTIGYALSADGIHFKERRQFIKPEFEWESFGCEDPRVTRLNGKYFVCYTALSNYPFSAEGIKIGVAITKDFRTIDAKHLVTHFNAKAMTLFPEKINGKLAALLSVHTDIPPAKMCVALFDREEQLWSREYWQDWYQSLDTHTMGLQRNDRDHIEIGAPPLKTKYGWLIIYSHIKNYFAPPPVFGIEAALLDLKNPLKIIARTDRAFMTPQEEYEEYGKVPHIVFPTGARMRGKTISLYYGAADTSCCLATFTLDDLLREMISLGIESPKLERFHDNPIITPNQKNSWEIKATFNTAAIVIEDNIHLLYRAMSNDNTSVIGYARTKDGFHIDKRLHEPMYEPRENFEKKMVSGGNSGCEDPRITRLGNMLYMCYTAYDGKNPPRVAFSSISINDFLQEHWNWSLPVLISPPGLDDKDAALFPKKINNKYVFLHRLGQSIWIDFVDTLHFNGAAWLGGKILMSPRAGEIGSLKIGIAAPPIETKYGWLLIYHGISKKEDQHYHLRAALLDLRDPTRVLMRTYGGILEPETYYEKEGHVSRVVFSSGAVVYKGRLFIYYGGADKVIGVATIDMNTFMKKILEEKKLQNIKR